MCLNTESVFTKIYPPKSKPFIVGILYIPPDKIDFVNCIDQIFSQVNTFETRECYLLGGFNINLLFEGEGIFSNRIGKIPYKEMLPLTKNI